MTVIRRVIEPNEVAPGKMVTILTGPNGRERHDGVVTAKSDTIISLQTETGSIDIEIREIAEVFHVFKTETSL